MNGDMHKSAFVVFFCKASILMFLQCECELFDDNVDVIKMIKGNFYSFPIKDDDCIWMILKYIFQIDIQNI